MKHFLSVTDLDEPLLQKLLTVARDLERTPVRETLHGKVLGLVFLNPSLRTLASFQAGMSQLGGSSFVITPGQGTWTLEMRHGVVMDGEPAEHVKEAVPVLGQYCDVLGVRTFAGGKNLEEDLAEPVLSAFREYSAKPLVNMESAMDHPCQALGDYKTLEDLEVPRDGKLVVTWAWHPKALPLAVPSAAVSMAARRGMHVTVLRPEGFALPKAIMDRARREAARTGGTVEETSDRGAALDGAHVVYAKSWQAPSVYGDVAAETALRGKLRDWCVGEEWFRPAKKDAIFMHCLPVRRNAVVADEVLDGPRSRVVKQAGNRLHGQKAILLHLLDAL